MAIHKTKLVVLAGFLLILSGLLMLSTTINAQKRRSGAAPRTAQPAAQYKTCPVCNGSGKTHEHVARYEEVRCSNCAGKGETLCDGRFGWPHTDEYYSNGERVICSKCNGNGRVRCPVCYGSGTRSVDRGYDVTKVCYNCKGSGRVRLTLEEIRAMEGEMVYVPGGSFLMGSPENEPGHKANEELHRVTVRSFYIGKYEVTQAQWRAVMGNNPSYFKGDDLPVEVSWDDAKEFCRKLSQMTGKEYRLPTEAEWEYACRAKTTGAYAGDLDAMAWYYNNAGNKTHPVGQKQPNAFGLYDMHGNVWEWCEDDWHNSYANAPSDGSAWVDISARGSLRVYRGGGWSYFAVLCRSAGRTGVAPGYRFYDLGFRLLRTYR